MEHLKSTTTASKETPTRASNSYYEIKNPPFPPPLNKRKNKIKSTAVEDIILLSIHLHLKYSVIIIKSPRN